jgi:RNA polymerase sigma-70 factor
VPSDPQQSAAPDLASLLRKIQSRLDSLYAESRASDWKLTHLQFNAAVERSVRKRFTACARTEVAVEEYLDTLHVEDLALASSCMQGSEPAWEHFIQSYRPYLRASAASITKNSRSGTDAQELADSLFAELYGLVDGKRGETSLFRYFHGRSSLRTWLRTILAQRHIDRLRQARRWKSLESEHDDERPGITKSVNPAPIDPHRDRYLHRFLASLTDCLATLDAEDRKRLELYYAREKTLAEIGRMLDEHESSVSRNLERARRELREKVEASLRTGYSGDSTSGLPPLSDAEIALCFEYAAEDAPIDFHQLFPERPAEKKRAGRKESL